MARNGVSWRRLCVYTLTSTGKALCMLFMGFPGSSDSKESACNSGDVGLIPWSGRSPGEENGYPLPAPIHLGWPYMAWLSFIELDKAVVHVIRLASFL